MSPNKAPGPNGLNASFYRIIESLLVVTSFQMFKVSLFGKLLTEVNHTFLTFISKVPHHMASLDWGMHLYSSFSVLLNGSLSGFFHSNRGIRQDDSLSPYIFVLVREY